MEKSSIKDCLGHLFGRVIARRDPKEMLFLQNFFGLSDNESLYSWGRKQSAPIGQRLVKAIFLLNLFGYKMTELEKLPPDIWRLISIIALDKTGADKAAESLGYSQTSELFRTMFGKRSVSDKMLRETKIFVSVWPGDIYLDLPDSFSFYFLGVKPEVHHHLKQEVSSKLIETLSPLDLELITSLIQVISTSTKVLEPQLDRLLKSEPATRQTLRNLLENREAKTSLFSISNQVYRLSQVLNALCSEKSLAQSKNV